MTFGAFNGFGIHTDQLFGNLTTFALKFVNRHFKILSDSASLIGLLEVFRFEVNLVLFNPHVKPLKIPFVVNPGGLFEESGRVVIFATRPLFHSLQRG